MLTSSRLEPTLTRVLLITGKGGVGKTSLAAATAVRAAARGARVLVTSTDPAHSLADALDVPLGDTPSPVPLPAGAARGGAVDGQQLDGAARLERHWSRVRDYLVSVLTWGGMGQVEAEELLLLPGMDELFSLIELEEQVRATRYELVVVDCAPTAQTLGLLALPEAFAWYADRVLGRAPRFARAVLPLGRGPVSRDGRGEAGPVPLPDPAVVDQAGRLHAQLARVHELLRDPRRTSVRLVVAPERLAVAEAQRTMTSVSLFGYAVDAVLVNRLLPDLVDDPYLARWKERHAEHLAEIRAAFGPIPVLTAPLLDDEPIGAGTLAALAGVLYGELDEHAVLHPSRPLEIRDEDGMRVLSVAVPFAAGDDVGLLRRGHEVHIEVAGARRRLVLPAALRRAVVDGARLVDGRLELRFGPDEVEAEAS